MAAGKNRGAGGALGPREGHMTRLAARAAGAGKGVAGRGEREEAEPVTCRRLRRPVVSGRLRRGGTVCFYSSPSKRVKPGGDPARCGGISRGPGTRDRRLNLGCRGNWLVMLPLLVSVFSFIF